MAIVEFSKVRCFGYLLVSLYLSNCGAAPVGTEHSNERGARHSADDCAKLAESSEFPFVAVVDYQMVKAQIFTPSCTGACHAPGKTQANIDLSTYAGAKANIAGSIADLQNDSMPIGLPPVAADKKALLTQWQSGGLIETAPSTGGSTTPTPTPSSTGSSGSTSSSGSTTNTTGNSSDSTAESAGCLY